MTDARGPFADFFGRLWRQKPLGIASAIVILILIMLAIFADALAHQGARSQRDAPLRLPSRDVPQAGLAPDVLALDRSAAGLLRLRGPALPTRARAADRQPAGHAGPRKE